MGNKKMGTGMMFNLLGAIFAYNIGSGFASGQEIVQYFSGWGSVGAILFVTIVTLLMMYTSYMAYAYAGRTRGLKDLNSIFKFYAGDTGGKVLTALPWIFNACCYFFMVSGFGNTLNQQWGIPLYIGCGLGVILSVGTTVLGLKRLVDVIGKIGPIVVVFSLLVGIAAAFHYWPLMDEGAAAVASGAVTPVTAGANVLLSALSFGGCCLLLAAAYIGTLGHELRDYKYKYTKIILGAATIGYPIACALLAFDHLGNIEAAASAAIPNLLLADTAFGAASGILSILFAIVILLAIYSTICPMLWTCVSTFIKDEKSIKYKLACVIIGVVVYVVCLFVPYQTLVNYIMTYCGYTGIIVCVVCAIRHFTIKAKDKKEGLMV